ncbi:MAG: OmpA family protein [Paracoccaceae bacterium]
MSVKPLFIAATLGAFTLTACVDPNAYPDDPNARTRQGAVTGAVLGGLFGATRKGDDKLAKAAIGAAAGAAIGGAIGQSLDRQAAELRNEIGDSRVRVVNTGSELVVTMPQDILFATDSAAVRPDLQSDLRAVAAHLQRYPDSSIAVVGHTDNTGSASYNYDLSTRRASAVAAVLMDSGVPSHRVQAYGRGEDQPVASNLTPEGRAQNRRVDIIIRPN